MPYLIFLTRSCLEQWKFQHVFHHDLIFQERSRVHLRLFPQKLNTLFWIFEHESNQRKTFVPDENVHKCNEKKSRVHRHVQEAVHLRHDSFMAYLLRNKKLASSNFEMSSTNTLVQNKKSYNKQTLMQNASLTALYLKYDMPWQGCGRII